VISLKPETLFW